VHAIEAPDLPALRENGAGLALAINDPDACTRSHRRRLTISANGPERMSDAGCIPAAINL
jgi:hypothetical protein